MEHEVFVPVSAEALRQTLRAPARVARCVPGLQQDADASAGPLSGRLKVRIGGHTITYRGALTLAEREGAFEAEAVGAEIRGSGSVKLTLTLTLTDAPGGTAVAFTAGSRADGRLAELDAGTVTAAGRRLLEKFAARLGEEAARDDAAPEGPAAETPPAEAPPAEAPPAETPLAETPSPGTPSPGTPASEGAGSEEPGSEGPDAGATSEDAGATGAAPEHAADSGKPGPGGSGPKAVASGAATEPEGSESTEGTEGTEGSEGTESPEGPEGTEGSDGAESPEGADGDAAGEGADADGPQAEAEPEAEAGPGPDADADAAAVFEVDGATTSGEGDFRIPGGGFEGEPPAEAAHARRTMIGRSAEEVDHAPPRGRYAPVPAPEAVEGRATLRWIAPAAALALASAVVVGRALRRRK
ncbi:SRPBCC domain-containing protein [Streptomyces sp. NPDC093085]|uniref:SRPBCC domain-containing protein n=1 Tax=Streptomyces sp. NPDC093085 TaxID=3155068 RepID=UPI0034239318